MSGQQNLTLRFSAPDLFPDIFRWALRHQRRSLHDIAGVSQNGSRDFGGLDGSYVGTTENQRRLKLRTERTIDGAANLFAPGGGEAARAVGTGWRRIFRAAMPQKMNSHQLRTISRGMLWMAAGLLFLMPAIAPYSYAQSVAGCAVFPANNIWNTPVDQLPVDANSGNYVAAIGTSAHGHADFGSGLWDGAPIGIPFVSVPGTQAKVAVTFDYSDESDPGPYPIPGNAPIEGGPS